MRLIPHKHSFETKVRSLGTIGRNTNYYVEYSCKCGMQVGTPEEAIEKTMDSITRRGTVIALWFIIIAFAFTGVLSLYQWSFS